MLAALAACCALAAPALQPEEITHDVGAAAVREPRRRYGGELKRDAMLWASMHERETTLRAATSLVAGMGEKELPQSFSWGDVNGINILTSQRNQHIPSTRTHLSRLRPRRTPLALVANRPGSPSLC